MSNNAPQQVPRVSQEYVDRLIQKLQPPPGVTKQQRLQQLLSAGQLTRQDIAILKAHQARRNAAIASQRAVNGTPTSNNLATSTNNGVPRSVPGKTLPGNDLPNNVVNNGNNSSPVVMNNTQPLSATPNVNNLQSASNIQQQQNPTLIQQQLLQKQQQTKAYQQKMNQTGYPTMNKEQWDKLTPQQKQMYRFKQIRNQAKVHKFQETDEDILKKYVNEPASLEFHIHDEYYRMGNTDNIISKSNPAIKEFLKYVAKKKLPDSLMEVIKDGGIKLYDGNVILQVFDHRLKTQSISKSNSESSENNNQVPGSNGTTLAMNPPDLINKEDTNNNTPNGFLSDSVRNPKEYRTILRMTQAAMYEDFSVSVDMKPVPDSFFLTYESEILATMNRSLNLQPILNPYLHDKSVWPEDEMFKPQINKLTGEIEWPCRSDIRGEITTENYKYKPLHQDVSQSKSSYEKLMLTYSQSSQHSNLPAGMSRISFANNMIGEAPRFERLRFIEAYRFQQKQKRENIKRGLQENPNISNGNGISNFNSMIPNGNMAMQNGNGANLPIKNEQMIGGPMMIDSKQSKRQKKPTKRQLAATESPIDYEDLSQNKKRLTNRKK